MNHWRVLSSKEDFDRYVLDLDSGYKHGHYGEPEEYPCVVHSYWWDDSNGPYSYDHDSLSLRELVTQLTPEQLLEVAKSVHEGA